MNLSLHKVLFSLLAATPLAILTETTLANDQSMDLNAIKTIIIDSNNEVSDETLEKLNSIILDNSTELDIKHAAINLIGAHKIQSSVDVLVEVIDFQAIEHSDFFRISHRERYPSVQALIDIGRPVVPNLIEEILAEEDNNRLKLIYYTLGKIFKNNDDLETAINDYFDKNITQEQSLLLKEAKTSIAKWISQ